MSEHRLEAVVMAAGEGRRLRPVTERYAKPMLPIDGRPVIVTLLQELRAAGVGRITVVVGHLADQIQRLLDGFPHELRFVQQPELLGAADAVLRAELHPPYFVLGADTRFAPGAVAAFVERAPAYENALAVRMRTTAPTKDRVKVEDGVVVRFDNDDPADLTTGAPLWLIGPSAHVYLDDVPGPPFEIKDAFQRAHDEGVPIGAVQVGPTRDLTHLEDVIRENFGYLRAL
jgi:glucose-1-phosphate thymidylyltransferase